MPDLWLKGNQVRSLALYINPILIYQSGMAGLLEAVNATATLRSSLPRAFNVKVRTL
jgi:hypothetical protein